MLKVTYLGSLPVLALRVAGGLDIKLYPGEPVLVPANYRTVFVGEDFLVEEEGVLPAVVAADEEPLLVVEDDLL